MFREVESGHPFWLYSATGIEPVTFAATDALTTEEKLACVATVVMESEFVPAAIKGVRAAAAVELLSPLTLVIRPVKLSELS